MRIRGDSGHSGAFGANKVVKNYPGETPPVLVCGGASHREAP